MQTSARVNICRAGNNVLVLSNNNKSFIDFVSIPRDELTRIIHENTVFKNEINELKARLEKSEAENRKLKKLVAKLLKNSANSSKPPSSDIVKGGKTKNKNGKKRKQGGQVGHEKHIRPVYGPEEIDNLYEYTLKDCPECSGKVEKSKEEPIVIQQVEIKDIIIEISEHRAYAYRCKKCGKIHYAQIPSDIIKAGLCGPTLTALVGYMKSALHASFSTIRKFLRDVVKIKISRGQLAKLINKVGDSLDIPYNELLNRIPLEKNVNVDETGHKENGKKFWTWCFRASLYVLFKIDKSRGSDVLIEILGTEFNGILGCDYFSAYRKYMREFDVMIQFCIAHLIRDIRFLITFPDEETRKYGQKLLDLLREMFRIIRDGDNKNEQELQKALNKIRRKILNTAINEVPSKLDKNGKETKKEAQNIADRFRKHGKAFFRFITTPGIGPTNNIAEQAIRFVVIDRYISQGTRSQRGRKNCERLWTVNATCSVQGRSTYEFIKTAVEAHLKGLPYPSLIPNTS